MMSETDLHGLTLEQLKSLKARIEDAIRAGIRAQRLGKAPAPQPGSGQDAPPPPPIDLVRERDAWLASRK